MRPRYTKEPFILGIVDTAVFVVALWLSLYIRYLEVPSSVFFFDHLWLFIPIIAIWLLVFFISGLYGKHTLILKSKIPGLILNAELVNSAIAVGYFYLFASQGLAPKTILFIYIVLSFLGILIWRLKGVSLIYTPKRENALIIGSGDELKDLYEEVNNNERYEFFFISSLDLSKSDNIDFQREILDRVYSENVSVIAIDLKDDKIDSLLQHLYNLVFSQVRFIDMHKIYEDIFDRIPLSLVRYNWFLENISVTARGSYDAVKRLMDLVISIPLFIISIPFQIISAILIKVGDGGSIFFFTERIGQNNKSIFIRKFRTMAENEREKITKVGRFLRKTRLDELPQLWNVLKGDISLIGPRPELVEYVKEYESKISFYNIRHLIKPGLSGWAQIHQNIPPKFKIGVEETKVKLSYDLYYIKNRSLILDLKIALQTIKTLLSRSGI